MDVARAIELAKKRTAEAKRSNVAKIRHRPVTATGIVQFMKEKSQEKGYYGDEIISKDNVKKIYGFIKLLQNNDYDGPKIYEFLEKCVENWQNLQNIVVLTDNKKKYILDTKPNIIDIIHCKTAILRHFQEESADPDEEFDMEAAWGEQW
jgi:hypothetical protein